MQKASDQVFFYYNKIDGNILRKKRIRPPSPAQTRRQNHELTHNLRIKTEHKTKHKPLERQHAPRRQSIILIIIVINQNLLKRHTKIKKASHILVISSQDLNLKRLESILLCYSF